MDLVGSALNFLSEIDWKSLAALFAGALIAWLVTVLYYEKASRDLAATSEQLRGEVVEVRRLVIVLINSLEESGAIGVTRDAAGNPVSFVVLTGEAHGSAGVTGRLSVSTGRLGAAEGSAGVRGQVSGTPGPARIEDEESEI